MEVLILNVDIDIVKDTLAVVLTVLLECQVVKYLGTNEFKTQQKV